MSQGRWFERYAFVVFVIIGSMGLAIAIPALVSVEAGAAAFERLDGLAPPATIAEDPEAAAYVAFLYRFAFGATAGLDLMTILVALFAFRRGARWAWVAFLYWPALFASNAATYEPSARPIQLFMLALTTAALAAGFRRAWRFDRAAGAAKPPAPGREVARGAR